MKDKIQIIPIVKHILSSKGGEKKDNLILNKIISIYP